VATKTKKPATKKKPPAKKLVVKSSEKVLVLRTCAANMSSHNGAFTWPENGHVEAPDWQPIQECGYGLHGWLRGEGDGSLADWAPDAKWLVVEVDSATVINLNGKVKFPCGEVVHCGDRLSATSYLVEHGCAGAAIIGGTATAGDGGTATAGDGGTATAGYKGTATAGYKGTATAGDGGTATAGYKGTATAGDAGILNIRWWDGNRYRFGIFYVGEDGIEANTLYRCENGKAVKVEK